MSPGLSVSSGEASPSSEPLPRAARRPYPAPQGRRSCTGLPLEGQPPPSHRLLLTEEALCGLQRPASWGRAALGPQPLQTWSFPASGSMHLLPPGDAAPPQSSHVGQEGGRFPPQPQPMKLPRHSGFGNTLLDSHSSVIPQPPSHRTREGQAQACPHLQPGQDPGRPGQARPHLQPGTSWE